jgi:hypothetical protein
MIMIRERIDAHSVPAHLGATFEEQPDGLDAAGADRVAQERKFLEVVARINGVDELRVAIDVAAQ